MNDRGGCIRSVDLLTTRSTDRKFSSSQPLTESLDSFQLAVYNRNNSITYIPRMNVRLQYQLRFGNQRPVNGLTDLTAKPDRNFPDAADLPVDTEGNFVAQQIIGFSLGDTP